MTWDSHFTEDSLHLQRSPYLALSLCPTFWQEPEQNLVPEEPQKTENGNGERMDVRLRKLQSSLCTQHAKQGEDLLISMFDLAKIRSTLHKQKWESQRIFGILLGTLQIRRFIAWSETATWESVLVVTHNDRRNPCWATTLANIIIHLKHKQTEKWDRQQQKNQEEKAQIVMKAKKRKEKQANRTLHGKEGRWGT